MSAETVTYERVPPIDATRPQLILIVGRKGSGKSVVARSLFSDWPADKIAVDVNGDADPGPDAERVTPPLDTRMPGPREDGRPRLLHVRIDPGDPSYREQLDQAAALVLYPQTRPALIWYDEWAEVAGPNNLGPNARRLLMQSRHYQSSAIMCCPRPKNIDVLSAAQADYVYMFDLPSPHDRERLADTMGWPPRALSEALDVTARRGPHWHLRYDARAHELVRCPPMPYAAGPHDKPS